MPEITSSYANNRQKELEIENNSTQKNVNGMMKAQQSITLTVPLTTEAQ